MDETVVIPSLSSSRCDLLRGLTNKSALVLATQLAELIESIVQLFIWLI